MTLMELAELLPEDVNWSDPLTPRVLNHVLDVWLDSIADDGYRTDNERCAARVLMDMLASDATSDDSQGGKE